jgi:hypothetical protein
VNLASHTGGPSVFIPYNPKKRQALSPTPTDSNPLIARIHPENICRVKSANLLNLRMRGVSA